MINNPYKSFPHQKVSSGAKTYKWFKDNVDAAENLLLTREHKIRNSHVNKINNYNLINNIINEDDIERVFNPMGFTGTFPASTQNYNKILPKINLLIGEERKRRFDYRIITVSEDAVSEFEESMMSALMELAVNNITGKLTDENLIQQKIQKIARYYKYEYQDVQQDVANKLVKYIWKEQDIKEVLDRGFYDLLIAGEEIYRIDIIAGNVVVKKVNPLNLFVSRSGDSPFVEDADIITEIEYMPVGQVIDEFYEYLSAKQIDQLEKFNSNSGGDGVLQHRTFNPIWGIEDVFEESGYNIPKALSGIDNSHYSYYDTNHNIRILRTRWKGRRKIYKVTYFDENGDLQETIKSEYYVANKELGETVTPLWISEWHEGTKIGEDIYVKMQVRDVQIRNRSNLSICHPGYVGVYYNINSNQAQSFVDILKPYQYLYNIFMKRLEFAFARYKAPIAELDLSKKPDTWDMEKWMYYAEVLGWLVVDPYNEGKEGAGKGVLAGHFNTTGKVINPDIGNYIQQTIMMLEFLENKINETSGVTPQREGAISNSETLGGVERAVTQSSHITEQYFAIHEKVKMKVLSTILETAKFAYKDDKNKIVQFILDDIGREYLRFDGSALNSSQFGIFVSNSQADTELHQSLKQLAHALVQNDKMDVKTLIDIFMSDSMSAIRRKIEYSEEERLMREEQNIKQQNEVQQAMIEADREMKMFEIENSNQIEREKMQNAIDIKVLDINAKLGTMKPDENNNGIADELEKTKIKLQEMKAKMDADYKKAQLKETERHNKIQEELERSKIKKMSNNKTTKK
jgi:hypothetical protein